MCLSLIENELKKWYVIFYNKRARELRIPEIKLSDLNKNDYRQYSLTGRKQRNYFKEASQFCYKNNIHPIFLIKTAFEIYRGKIVWKNLLTSSKVKLKIHEYKQYFENNFFNLLLRSHTELAAELRKLIVLFPEKKFEELIFPVIENLEVPSITKFLWYHNLGFKDFNKQLLEEARLELKLFPNTVMKWLKQENADDILEILMTSSTESSSNDF